MRTDQRLPITSIRNDRARAVAITVRSIELARRASSAGRSSIARRAWHLACRTAFRCGGLSGCSLGGAFILIQRNGRDYVAHVPAELAR